MSDLSGRLSGGQAISGSLSGGSTLRGGLSMGGVSPAVLLNKADVITDTASGSIVSISDGMASPVIGLDVEIEPIQDLHGYANPWPAGGGKNKVDVTSATVSSQTVLYSVPLSAGTYTLSAVCTNSTTINGYLSVRLNGVAKGTVTIASGDSNVRKNVTFTITENDTYDIVGSGASSGYNFTVSNVQLESGSTMTDFAPYSNICPISGRSEVKATRTGKNLIDPSHRDDTSQTVHAWYKTTGFLLKGGTAYTLSNNVGNNVGVYIRDMQENVLAVGETGVASYTPASDILVYFRAYKSSGIESVELQLEVGSVASTFELYTGNTYTLQLGQTVYGGTVDVVRGKLKITQALVDLGTLTWTTLQSSTSKFRSEVSGKKNGVGNIKKCSQYKIVTGGVASITNGEITDYVSYSNKNIFICDESCDGYTATQFKTAMSGVQLAYELATPVEVTLTAEELDILYADNNIWADSGDTAVEYRADTKLWILKKIAQALNA